MKRTEYTYSTTDASTEGKSYTQEMLDKHGKSPFIRHEEDED